MPKVKKKHGAFIEYAGRVFKIGEIEVDNAEALVREFPKELARRAKAMEITTEAQLDRWVVECRDWMTHLVEVECHRNGLSDDERKGMADELARIYGEHYLDLYRMVAGRIA